MYHELHWLDVPETVTYKLNVMVYHCLLATARRYLSELSSSVADMVSRRHLRSVCLNKLITVHCGLACFQCSSPVGIEFFGCQSLAAYLRDDVIRLTVLDAS